MTEETAPSASAAVLESAATSAAESAPPLLPAAAPIPLAGPLAPATTSEAPKKRFNSVKIDPKQGRLSFGKPGEGWKIARPTSPSPQVEDASVQVEGSGVGGGQGKPKKASIKGGKIKTVPKGLDTSAGTPKKGKGRVVDFEQEEIKALMSARKAVTGAEKVPKKGSKVSSKSGGGATTHASASEVLEVASVSSSPDPDASGTATAGPSKPRSNLPSKSAIVKSKRKTVTVHLSSGSETEGGSVTSKAGLSSLSIIIDDDDDPPRPLSSPVAKPKKTAHPFFGGAASSSSNKRPKLTSKLGASAELAIDVEAEDAAARPPASSWYVSRLGQASTAKASSTTPQDARWPTREETLLAQYAHLPSASGSALVSQEAKRAKLETLARADCFYHRPLPSVTSAPVASSSRQPPLHLLQPVIPEHLAHHPAFDKLLRTSPSHSSDLWADRFRPLAAGEVLGNETEATYLRDWLVAVQVKVAGVEEKDKRKAAKRQIVRKVDKSQRKKKKVSRKDDWIVDDDDFGYEDEADPIQFDTNSSDEDTIANLKRATFPQPPLTPSKLSHHLTTQTRPDESDGLGCSRAGSYPPLAKSSLSSCILLVGPSGSGKTAAIYACANELGWEIFEVYPGLRRSGVALTEMVGEVGRNHLVGRGGTGGGAAGASVQSAPDKKASLAGFFKKPVKDTDFGFMQKTEPLDGVDRASSSSVHQSGGGGETIRQSCILLEEVDILFQEDKGFWPAVVTLVSQSRRPVILTCNDLSIIPVDDLPLQTTLVFLPPPADVVTPYLKLLAHAGGLDVSSQTVDHLLREMAYHSFTAGVSQLPGHPAPSQPPDTTDLRRTINNLQALRGKSETSATSGLSDVSSERDWDVWESQVADWARPLPSTSATSQDDPMPSSERDTYEKLLFIVAHLDSVSFVNSAVDWRNSTASAVFDPDQYAPSDNELVDYADLYKPAPDPFGVDLPEYGYGRSIAQLALGLSRSEYDTHPLTLPPRGAEDLLDWIPRRRTHVGRLLDMLEPLIEAPAPLLPSPALILDYVPYIQTMVVVDDVVQAEDESQAAAGLGRGTQGRVMRASAQAGMAALAKWTGGTGGRIAYQRQLWQLEGHELQAARDSVLKYED